MQNIAVILAGGHGSRFESNIPKQFAKIHGKEIIKLTVEKFAVKEINQIIVAVIEEYIPQAANLLQEYPNLHIIKGGKTRTESSFNALKFIDEMQWQNSFVLIHDCARPFISSKDIQTLISAKQNFQAVTLATHSRNTLYHTENNTVQKIIDRSTVFEAQTPQCFHFKLIFSCYNKLQESQDLTDDVSVVLEHSHTPIHIIHPTTKNNKITYKHDIE